MSLNGVFGSVGLSNVSIGREALLGRFDALRGVPLRKAYCAGTITLATGALSEGVLEGPGGSFRMTLIGAGTRGNQLEGTTGSFLAIYVKLTVRTQQASS